MSLCFHRKWNHFVNNFPVLLFGTIVILVILGGGLIAYNESTNKAQLIQHGFSEAQLEKFTEIFQHIDYRDLIKDKDCQRFYKTFYGENQ